MPKLSDHHSSSHIKALYIGDSGTGKTGSLASLANAGYNLYIADFDNGLDILRHLLTPEAASRVEYETFTDEYAGGESGARVKRATAWAAGMKYVESCVKRASLQDILVIDSLTLASKAAFHYALSLNGRLPPARPQIQDWGDAMDRVETLLGLLYSSQAQANIIILSHITYIGNEEEGTVSAYPSTLGNKLPPKVGRYFNTMIQAARKGKGRVIHTQPRGLIPLKNPAPNKLKAEYPLETGLAEIFEVLRGPLKS